VPLKGHPLYESMEVFENKLTEWAKGRRRRFASIDELTEEYRQSRATRNWVAGEHELMARSVLRKSPDGDGYELTCAPENEAAIYAQALILDLWPKASEFGGPVKLVGCDPNFKGAPATGRPTRRSPRRRLRLRLCREHRPSAADRETRRVHRLTLEFLGKHGWRSSLYRPAAWRVSH